MSPNTFLITNEKRSGIYSILFGDKNDSGNWFGYYFSFFHFFLIFFICMYIFLSINILLSDNNIETICFPIKSKTN